MNSPEFVIAGRVTGLGRAPFCIAEVGINHNGDIELAKRLAQVAKDAGAEAVKFQTFKADEFCGDPGQMFTYSSMGRSVTEPMLEMFRRYEFAPEQWREIKAHCEAIGITFMSTPQNHSDLRLLLELGIPAIKVGSDDFVNIPLLKSYAATGLPIILSCGMADLAEVYISLEAVGALDGYPVSLLLCTSQYPTPLNNVHLNRLITLRAAFPMLVLGFSDHTIGPLASSLAVALGACVFEKHFTISHDLPGPDHWFSEDPDGLKLWISQIRDASVALGNGIVRPTPAERELRKDFRRVIVAAVDISPGVILGEENMTMRRVAGGLGATPALFSALAGRPAPRGYAKGEPIQL